MQNPRRTVMGALVFSGFAAGFVLTQTLLFPAEDNSVGGFPVRPQAGTEMLAVFVASSTCGASEYPGLREALNEIRDLLAADAVRDGKQFISVGVALDQDPWLGIDFLKRFGPFDEILSGGSWVNTGALAFIVRDFPTRRTIPQLILIERDIEIEGISISFSTVTDRLVGRKIGAGAIVSFAQALRATASPEAPF